MTLKDELLPRVLIPVEWHKEIEWAADLPERGGNTKEMVAGFQSLA